MIEALARAEDRGPLFWRLCWGATAVVFVLTLIGLDAVSLLDVDEPRFATSSRNMIREGHWIVPWFNGNERFDKPVLIYWFQAACMMVFGQNEFAARLPSAIAVASTVPTVALVGRALQLRPFWAVGAGVMVATCSVAQVMAHGCTADGLLLGTTAALAWLQVRAFTGDRTPFVTWGIWVLGGLAFLVKGPPALIAPLALAIGMWRAGFRPNRLRMVIGVLISSAIVLGWAIPALIVSEGRFWSVGVMHHVVERSMRPFEGHGGYAPWWYLFYFVAVPGAFMPWGSWLLYLRNREHRRGYPVQGTGKLLAFWFWLTFAVFTASTSKLFHYPLPAFPALALAIAFALQKLGETARPEHVQVGRLGMLVGVVFGVGCIAAFPALKVEMPPAAPVAGAVFACGMVMAGRILAKGRVALGFATHAIAWVAGFAMLTGIVLPGVFRESAIDSVRKARAKVFPAGLNVYQYELVMPSLVFYLERDVPVIRGKPGGKTVQELAVERMLEPGTVVVLRRSHINQIEEHLPNVDPGVRQRVAAALESPVAVLSGFLPSKGKIVDLIVLDASR